MSAIQALANRRVWHLTCIGFLFDVAIYPVIIWMPQMVKSLSRGYSNTAVGFLVMIPYLVALLAMVIISRSSDRRLERRYHAAIPMIAGGIALLLLDTTSSPLFAVALLSPAVAGCFSLYGPFFSLPNEFLTGFSAASGIALINSITNLGGFVGLYAFGAISERTGSLSRGLVLAGVSLFVSAVLLLILPKKRWSLAQRIPWDLVQIEEHLTQRI